MHARYYAQKFECRRALVKDDAAQNITILISYRNTHDTFRSVDCMLYYIMCGE